MYKREQDITPKSKLLWSSSNSHCIITADKGGHGENECVVGRDQAGAAVGLVVGAEVVGEVNGDTVGPGVVGESVGLVVEGMTCSSCVSAIEGLLLGLEGVTHASVSLMAKSAQVGYNERKAVTLTLTPTPITTLTPTLPLPLTRWDTTSARSTCPACSHASSRAATRRR